MTRDVHTDFAVVGSGAGGAVTAYALARAHERVTVVERGRFVPAHEMPESELEALGSLYKDGGAQLNRSRTIALLQGTCVGGSTVLANMVCFRLPEDVRRDYANAGFDLRPDALAQSYDRVESVLNVHETKESRLNAASGKLEDGMRACGLRPRRFRHATLGCNGCGYCNVGCRFGAKMDAARTWIPMARRHGAEILPRMEAVRLLTRNGAVSGLLCRDLERDEPVLIRAKRYVLSGGAINTPELLLRSGILSDRVGRRMSVNIGAMMVADYPEPLDAFDGVQMGVYHRRDGYTIEQDHNPYLSFCLTQPPWLDRESADAPTLYRHLTTAGVLVPTAASGRVSMHPLNALLPRALRRARVDIELDEDARRAMVRGYKQLAKVFLASGARRVLAPTNRKVEMRSPDDTHLLDDALADRRNFAGLGSSHPFGGTPIGDDDRLDVVRPDFSVRGVANLFVMDASLFPQSTVVNPVLTVMAVADYAARSLGDVTQPVMIEEGPAHDARMLNAVS